MATQTNAMPTRADLEQALAEAWQTRRRLALARLEGEPGAEAELVRVEAEITRVKTELDRLEAAEIEREARRVAQEAADREAHRHEVEAALAKLHEERQALAGEAEAQWQAFELTLGRLLHLGRSMYSKQAELTPSPNVKLFLRSQLACWITCRLSQLLPHEVERPGAMHWWRKPLPEVLGVTPEGEEEKEGRGDA